MIQFAGLEISSNTATAKVDVIDERSVYDEDAGYAYDHIAVTFEKADGEWFVADAE